MFDLMFSTDAGIAEEVTAEVFATRVFFVRPFITIGHDEDDGRTESVFNFSGKGIDSLAFFLPGTFVSVDTVNEIENRKGSVPFGNIDVYISI